MGGQEKLMRARNRFSPEGETEIFGQFKRSAKAYFLRAFFGKLFWQCLAMTVFFGVLLLTSLLKSEGGYDFFFYLPLIITCIWPFIYFLNIIINLWKWKYEKHVVVTNEGIWRVYCGHPFWGEKSFDGKTRFFSADWSVYEWAELSGIFEEQCKISKLCKLKDLILVRWDGEEPVRFLKPDDFEAIMKYGQKKLNPKKRKKRAEKPHRPWWQSFFMREE